MRGTSWLVVALVIIIGSVVGVAGGTFLAVILPSMRATGTGLTDMFGGPFAHDGRYVRILLIGEDDTSKMRKNGHGLSDTLVVLGIDTDTKEVRAISIPRDTKVEIPGSGTHKVNAANAIGGPETAKTVLESLLGVPINYYIATTTSGLRGLVDMLGGVYIKIDENMRYTDRHAKLYINLRASPEKQLLDGKKAEGYVRFRHDRVGDSGFLYRDGKKIPAGRTVRQQLFMRALVNRIGALPTKRERADVLRRAYEKKYIVSNLRMNDWDGLADFLKDIKPEKMVMDVLPGGPGNIHGASYWLVDDAEKVAVVNRNLLFQGMPEEEMPKIEVLNGSGISGAARRVAERLTKAGFEVTKTDNAPSSDYSECYIITRKGKTPAVERIAQLLNCHDIREETAVTGSPDVTVVVGRSYSAQL
ncbi:MAG: LCP family protein [Armatimonadetes bacterium]|nr:LCP family protein [Armatimonadota bacterium]